MVEQHAFPINSAADSPEGIGFCNIKNETARFCKKLFICTSNLFKKYAHLVEEHDCDGVSIILGYNGKEKWAATTPAMLDLSLINKPEAIRFLSLGGYGGLDNKFDTDMFAAFSNLRYLWIEKVKAPGIAIEQLKNLQALSVDFSVNKWQSAIFSFENIKYLRGENLSMKLVSAADSRLETLFLFFPKLDDFHRIGEVPSITTLYLSRIREKIDISLVNKIKNLRNLKVEKCPNVHGWEDLSYERMSIVEVDILPSSELLSKIPDTTSFFAKKVKGVEDEPVDRRRDLREIGDPFRSITDVWYPRKSG